MTRVTGSDLEGGCGGVYPGLYLLLTPVFFPQPASSMRRPSNKGLLFHRRSESRASPILFFPPLSVDDVSKVRHGSGEVIPASELETKFPYPRSQMAAGQVYTSRMVNLN